MIRSKIAPAIVAAVLAVAALTGCSGSNRPYYDTICVDPLTQIRVPDFTCTTYPSWVYYVPRGYLAPGYNQHITNYTVNNFHRPSNATIHSGGVPSAGGTATKFKSGNLTVRPTSAPKPKSTSPRPQAPRAPQPTKTKSRR